VFIGEIRGGKVCRDKSGGEKEAKEGKFHKR
jgi:hypothetical protein